MRLEELAALPVPALAERLRTRAVSAVEVVTTFLRQLEATTHLNAVITIAAEHALAAARIADRRAATTGRRGELPPLHGVPVSVKDVLATAGIATTAGLPERRSHHPARDATAVARLRAAGAIVLAKTSVPPRGVGGITDNPLVGRTANPYDPTRTVGGSSGGEAAVQAVGGCAVGLGSDSGGSLRVPAHLCGVAALKPTSGRVPATGGFDLPGGLSDPRSQIGPLARHVASLAAVFPVIAGPDGVDSAAVPVPIGDPGRVELPEVVVAVSDSADASRTTAETRAVVRTAADVLAQLGVRLVEGVPGWLVEEAGDITRRYWTSEELDGGGAARLLADWDRFRTRVLAFHRDVDVILCPTAPGPAREHDDPDPGLFDHTLPFSLTGQPCIVVPAGRTGSGLPIGVQLAARPWREDVVLALGHALESVLGGWSPPAAS